MNDIKPFVSVIVITYGHEAYIRQALDSILMQKVNFNFEVLVGEDCSPDATRSILKKYERLYPNKFVMIYRNKNIGAKKNEQDLIKRANGKYLAFLEGDDFWISEDKLQKQVDFLEKHSEFIATAHNVDVVDKNGKKILNKIYPECKDEIYSLKHYKNGILPGQTATIVMRNIFKDNNFDLSLLTKIDPSMPGDRVLTYLLATYGKIYCFQEIMSAYRYVTDSGSSFSAVQSILLKENPIKQIEYYKIILRYTHNNIKNKESIKTIESIYFFHVIYLYLKKKKGIKKEHLIDAWNDIIFKVSTIEFVVIKMLKIPFNKIIFFFKKQSLI